VPLSSARTGELSILLGALLWSTFPVITIFSYGSLAPFFSGGIATLFASTFFAVLLTAKGEWHFILEKGAWKDILLTSFFIGMVFYGLFFVGLRHTTAGNAAILSLMEVFFSFVILGLFMRHEPLLPSTIIGGSCMVLGALLVLLPKGVIGLQMGDLLIILATAFCPLGNRAAQRARKHVPANIIMFLRSVISGGVLLGLAFLFESTPSFKELSASLIFLLINGILLLGLSKIFWIEGIHRIPITKAISIESITPLFTLIVAYFLLQEQPTILQIVSLIPIGLGMVLLTKRTRSEKITAGDDVL